MIKTQSILQGKPEHFSVANLQSSVRARMTSIRHDVRTYNRDNETFFVVPAFGPEKHNSEPLNPRLREITSGFLGISTREEAANFLATYGILGGLFKPGETRRSLQWLMGESSYSVRWSELLALQRVIKEAWTRPPQDWNGGRGEQETLFALFCYARDERRPKGWSESQLVLALIQHGGSLPLVLDFSGERPVMQVMVISVLDALLADLYFTIIAGLSSAFCARHDCGKLFQKATKHEKKYCSPVCAHVESVRKFRNRKSRAK